MRLDFPNVLLPLWAFCALPLVAQEQGEAAPQPADTPQAEPAQPPAEATPGQQEPAGQEVAVDPLKQLLDDMEKTQDDDFCAAASYVLDATGDELAFHTRMKELAEQGHPVAMLWHARSLRCGESPYGDEEEDALFRELVLGAAAKDYLPAMVQAAQTLFYNGVTDEERAQGMELLRRACKMGSAKARAAYLVMSGLLVDKNSDLEAPEIASELKRHNFYAEELVAETHWGEDDWLRTASEHGSAWAAYELSRRRNLKNKEALAYLRLAAERHLPEAMTTLGCLLCLGPLPKDFELSHASALPEKAMPKVAAPVVTETEEGQEANDGNTLEMTPSAESVAEGLRLLRCAVAMGDERAAAFTAMACASGVAGEVPAERIAALFHYAHVHDHPFGTTGWGYCQVLGKGCERNQDMGMAMLARMSHLGVAWADLALYHLYHEGVGVPQNETKANEYRKKFESRQDFYPFVSSDPQAPFFPVLK